MRRFGGSLAHRGEGEPRAWVSAAAGLGCCHLPATPEAVGETVPYIHAASGVVVTADVRLDNREELIAVLGLSPGSGGMLADSALLAEAYLKWGEGCPGHLLGDFAFAVWDARNSCLFAASDHFGVRPLYYVADHRWFAFATEPRALLRLPGVSQEIDYVTVAGHLAEVFDDSNETAYKAVRRLRGADKVIVTRGVVQAGRYYQLDPERTVALRSDAEYAEAFREILFRAVHRRLRSCGPVGCMLSGGLDSSAVTCVAAEIARTQPAPRLEAFSLIYPDRPECDESHYIQAALRRSGLPWHPVPVDDRRSLDDVRRLAERLQEPNVPFGAFANGTICEQAAAAGMRVVLDGHGGDEIVSLGYQRLRELFDDRKVFQMSYEYLCLARSSPDMNGWRGLLRVLTNMGVAGRVKRRLLLTAAHWRGADPTPAGGVTWPFLDRQLVLEGKLAEREAASRVLDVDSRFRKRWHHRHVTQVAALGSFDRLARLAGTGVIELRYPMWDKDLVEFCLALPSRQKLRRGYTRIIMRTALAGVVPRKITHRREKTDFLPHATACLKNLEESACKSLIASDNTREIKTLSHEWLSATLNRFFKGQTVSSFDQQAIWRSLAFASWLQAREANSP